MLCELYFLAERRSSDQRKFRKLMAEGYPQHLFWGAQMCPLRLQRPQTTDFLDTSWLPTFTCEISSVNRLAAMSFRCLRHTDPQFLHKVKRKKAKLWSCSFARAMSPHLHCMVSESLSPSKLLKRCWGEERLVVRCPLVGIQESIFSEGPPSLLLAFSPKRGAGEEEGGGVFRKKETLEFL